jgi:hypothetical protein
MLRCGELTLTSLCLVAPHLTETNHVGALARVRHRSKREVEDIVASLRSKPDVPATIRKLPERRPIGQPICCLPVVTAPPDATESFSDAPVRAPFQTAERSPSPAPATVRPLAPSGTNFRSRSARRLAQSFSARKISCATRSLR